VEKVAEIVGYRLEEDGGPPKPKSKPKADPESDTKSDAGIAAGSNNS